MKVKSQIITFLLLSVTACLTDGHATTFPQKQWSQCSPESKGMDKKNLDAFKNTVKGSGVVIKDGCIVAAWGKYKQSVDWASAGKPILSALLLQALKEERIVSVDEYVAPVVEEVFRKPLSEKDQSMTWAHLANMVSAYARGERPGERWAYNDYAIALYCELLERVYGTSLDQAFQQRFKSLQFENGAGLKARQGCHMKASPQDFARIGWWFLNRGQWQENQLLPKQYFDMYIRPQVDHTVQQTTKAGSNYLNLKSYGGSSHQTSMGPGYYGFNLWFNTSTNGKRFWPDAPHDAYQLNGRWGKRVIAILPSCQMVAAVVGQWGKMQPGIESGMNQTMKRLAQAGRCE
jgi:CubicO group peptidase (beta-lactamase class C family)